MSRALALPSLGASLERYLFEVSRLPLLDRRQELALARRYVAEGDVDAAHQLVVANLRFVVKVALGYRGYGLSLLDLIQEGNVGLMHAVKRFDPERGYRLITYAVHWIRAFIQSFIMRTWSVVRMGSGRVAKRLFFGLRLQRAQVENEQGGESAAALATLAHRLGASEAVVSATEARLARADFHLDAPVGDDATSTFVELQQSETIDPETAAAGAEARAHLAEAVARVEPGLDAKERQVLEGRLLAEDALTLHQLGQRFGLTRERVRQIEQRVVSRLREQMVEGAGGSSGA